MHEKKQNSSATALYQMIKINAAPNHNLNKEIQTLCFTDIYAEGKFGEFYQREKRLQVQSPVNVTKS